MKVEMYHLDLIFLFKIYLDLKVHVSIRFGRRKISLMTPRMGVS